VRGLHKLGKIVFCPTTTSSNIPTLSRSSWSVIPRLKGGVRVRPMLCGPRTDPGARRGFGSAIWQDAAADPARSKPKLELEWHGRAPDETARETAGTPPCADARRGWCFVAQSEPTTVFGRREGGFRSDAVAAGRPGTPKAASGGYRGGGVLGAL